MLPVSLWLKEEGKGPTYRKFMGFYMKMPTVIDVIVIDVMVTGNHEEFFSYLMQYQINPNPKCESELAKPKSGLKRVLQLIS
ncbi:hypothetical protein DUI87_04919 [Hirundo rustica rustica]|uniref:Uncharacterized protein n=1 Tax=Hirundo rustica rustica TaxID=333673 RepID=A0A3M0KZC5_HIRRU|nr:hypothetical protein DUI87_04919 [Hirundo rustica rustica]